MSGLPFIDFSGVEVMGVLFCSECSEKCEMSLVLEDLMNEEGHTSFNDLL